MAFSQFPAPAAGGAEEAAFAATIPALQTTYEHIQDFQPAIYAIDVSPVTTQAQLVFVDATSVLATLTTTLGLVAVQLSTPATKVYITTLAGGTVDAIVSITKTAAILTPDDIGNGTLDTVNTTGAYNETGLLSVLAFGGGAAGVKGGIGTQGGGSGGASGGVALGFVYNNGATTITIGAKGTAETQNVSIVAPTQSSFGNLLTSSTDSFFYTSGAGAGGGQYNAGAVGTASRSFPSFNTTSTTGGGGGGGGTRSSGAAKVGGGSGIGTGGTSAPSGGTDPNTSNPTTAAIAATGKAAGGGGGSGTGNNNPNAVGRFGSDGSDGVVYILRGF